MENEIKVNEFVRTKDGQIYKIEDGTEFYEDIVNVGIGIIPDVDGIWVDKEHFTYVDKRDIVKHSSNLIDLIECGDYVNGKEVKHIADFEGIEQPIRKVIFVDKTHLIPGETAENEDIENIATKEQFESISYKVKE